MRTILRWLFKSYVQHKHAEKESAIQLLANELGPAVKVRDISHLKVLK